MSTSRSVFLSGGLMGLVLVLAALWLGTSLHETLHDHTTARCATCASVHANPPQQAGSAPEPPPPSVLRSLHPLTEAANPQLEQFNSGSPRSPPLSRS